MNTKNIFCIYPHLGLGDQVVCNGIVRNICKKFFDKEIILVTRPQDLDSVAFMYRDLTNINFMSCNDHVAHNLLDDIQENKKIYIGHHHLNRFTEQQLCFDEAFYKQVGLSFDRRWSDFFVRRDFDREQSLFVKFDIQNKPYAFIHEDSSRNFIIDNIHINPNLAVLTPRPNLTTNIFDYLTLIENASEVHCIDSSFKLMIDSVCNITENLFYHLRLKNNIIKDPTTFSKVKLPWKIIC